MFALQKTSWVMIPRAQWSSYLRHSRRLSNIGISVYSFTGANAWIENCSTWHSESLRSGFNYFNWLLNRTKRRPIPRFSISAVSAVSGVYSLGKLRSKLVLTTRSDEKGYRVEQFTGFEGPSESSSALQMCDLSLFMWMRWVPCFYRCLL